MLIDGLQVPQPNYAGSQPSTGQKKTNPMVEMKLGVNLSSSKRRRRELFPTPGEVKWRRFRTGPVAHDDFFGFGSVARSGFKGNGDLCCTYHCRR
jgi:hypothetical protein